MPKASLNCPNCRQPIAVDVQQLFDVGVDPTAKQRLLSGAFNLAQCPHCGYNGNLATPIVYHDPAKELLLTFFPPEIGMQRDEQERLIGSLINQIISNLPQEKRKGYLLNPKSVLTMQGLAERILESDGVTREMLDAQQKRLGLIQRMLSSSESSWEEMAKADDELIDADFYVILARLAEAAAATGDKKAAQQLADLQKVLLPKTTYGRKILERTKEMEAAAEALRDAGEGLTRDQLLDMVLKAPNDARLSAYVSLVRPGMDYAFFQMLSERIDRARGDGRARLAQVRETLLEYTRQYDQQLEARMQGSRELLDQVLKADDIEQAAMQNLDGIDDFFLQEYSRALDDARKSGDLERLGKLQKLGDFLQKASAPPPEVAFLEELIQITDEAELRKVLETNRERVTPDFLNALSSIVSQIEGHEDPQLTEQIKRVYQVALRLSMEANLGQ